MRKNNILLVIMVALVLPVLVCCQVEKNNPDLRRFSAQYKALQGTPAKTTELETLLATYEKRIPVDNNLSELLKSRILIQLSRFDEAAQRLDRLLTRKPGPGLAIDAGMAKVQLLIYRRRMDKALTLFKTIEPRLKAGKQLYSAWLYFALYSPDGKVRKLYADKFLETPGLPKDLSKLKVELYRGLASDARENRQLTKARELLSKAISEADGENSKETLESELNQMDLIGKPGPNITTGTWVNTPGSGLSPSDLKGKVVLIAFRAPWSESCRNMTPVLNDVYSQYKTNGLVLLDFMKLYGTYADEIETGKKVTETEEITLLKGYIKRHGITHPVAISTEGLAFDDFKVTGIPALFFIDRAGDINDIRIGSGHPQRIHDKIKKLLEEK